MDKKDIINLDNQKDNYDLFFKINAENIKNKANTKYSNKVKIHH